MSWTVGGKQKDLGCIILAAGLGTRLKSDRPKALHEVCGKPMIVHILEHIRGLEMKRRVIVVGYLHDQIRQALGHDDGLQFAMQTERKGTGHAVMMATEHFRDFDGDVLVVSGDTPLIRESTFRKLVERHRHQDAAATILTAELESPEGYGRILRNHDQSVLKIVEHKDANIYELKVREINTGTYVFDSKSLFEKLEKITPENKQGEYYLPDVIDLMVKAGQRVEAYVASDASEVMGVNNRIQQAEAERILRQRIREKHMLEGVTLIDPASTFIDESVTIGKDTVIYPQTYLWGDTEIGSGCVIGPQAEIINTKVEDGAQVRSAFLRKTIIDGGEVVPPMTVRDGQ